MCWLQLLVIISCAFLYDAVPTPTTQNSLSEHDSGEIVRLAPNLNLWSRRNASQKRLCETCLNSASCKRFNKCDRCNKYCDNIEWDENIEETSKNVTKDVTKVDNNENPNEIKKVQRNDILGSRKEVQSQSVPVVNPFEEDGTGTGISNNTLLYYTVADYGPGPTQNLLARLLQLKNQDNVDKLIVLVKPKTDSVASRQQQPVIIDSANVLNGKQQQETIRPLDLQLAARIDKGLTEAIASKVKMAGKSLLSVDEMDKIISSIIKNFNKLNQDINQNVAKQSNDDTVEESNVVASSTAKSVEKSAKKQQHRMQKIENRFRPEKEDDSNEIPPLDLDNIEDAGPALHIDKKSAENFQEDNQHNPTVGSNWLEKSAEKAANWIHEHVGVTPPPDLQNDEVKESQILVEEIHDLSRKFEHLEDMFRKTCGKRFEHEQQIDISPTETNQVAATALPLASRFAETQTPSSQQVGEPAAVAEEFEKANETVGCSEEDELAGVTHSDPNDFVGSALRHQQFKDIVEEAPAASSHHIESQPLQPQHHFQAQNNPSEPHPHSTAQFRKTVADRQPNQFVQAPEDAKLSQANQEKVIKQMNVPTPSSDVNNQGIQQGMQREDQMENRVNAGSIQMGQQTTMRPIDGVTFNMRPRLSEHVTQQPEAHIATEQPQQLVGSAHTDRPKENDTVACSKEKDDDSYEVYRKSENSDARNNEEDPFDDPPVDVKVVKDVVDESSKAVTENVNVQQDQELPQAHAQTSLLPSHSLLDIKPIQENLEHLLHHHHHHQGNQGIVGDRQQPRVHLGKLIPFISQQRDKVIFSGDGVRLPLNMQKNNDGTINLFVDLGKMVNGEFVGNTNAKEGENSNSNSNSRERREHSTSNIPNFVIDTVFKNLNGNLGGNSQIRKHSQEESGESSEEKMITANPVQSQTTIQTPNKTATPQFVTEMKHLPTNQIVDVTSQPSPNRSRRSLSHFLVSREDEDETYNRKLQKLNSNMQKYYAKRSKLEEAYKNRNKVDLEETDTNADMRRRMGFVDNILTWLHGVRGPSRSV